MSKRINHAAEAMGCLQGAGDGRNLATDASVNAIAHAILALTEQQLIANLIALAESGRTTVNGARAALSTLYTGCAEDGAAHMALRPEIAQALQIGETDD